MLGTAPHCYLSGSYYDESLGLELSAVLMMVCFIGTLAGFIYFCVHEIRLSAG